MSQREKGRKDEKGYSRILSEKKKYSNQEETKGEQGREVSQKVRNVKFNDRMG